MEGQSDEKSTSTRPRDNEEVECESEVDVASRSVKRARLEKPADDASTDPAASSAESPKTEATATISSQSCAICLEGLDEGKELLEHCCPQCTKGAWKICEPCNDTILSRRCPVCHGDYKAIEFYEFMTPESVENELAGLAVAAFSRVKVSLMASSNVMIWLPTANQLLFSLPVDTSVPKRDIQYLRSVIVPSEADVLRLRNGVFSFTNKIWDALEAAEESTEQTGVREMLAWVLNSMSNPDAVLFSSLTKDQQLELLSETLRNSVIRTEENRIVEES